MGELSLRNTTRLFLILVFILTALPAPDVSAQQQKAAEPSKTADPEAKRREYFTDLELITHEGRKVRFYTDMLKDKVVLISTYYLNCGAACPIQNVVLSRLQTLLGGRFGKEIFIVSVSVDPDNDKWEQVREYAKVWDAKKGWTFLTGKKVNMDWVNYKLGLYVPRPEDHDTRYIVMNMKTDLKRRMPPYAKAEELAAALIDLLDDGKKSR